MTDTIINDDPAEIEREIRRTQDNMSSTIDRIGDQLTVKNLFNAVLDKADENNVDARMLLDGARRNPIALGLIAIGAIWLVSEKDAKIPSISFRSKGSKSSSNSNTSYKSFDHDHRDYVTHMAAVEQRADEDAESYQRRRDTARSNFFMMEREHGEDDSSFRARLDAMTEKFREKRRGWSDSASRMRNTMSEKLRDKRQGFSEGRDHFRDATKEKATMAANKGQELYTENPLIGGLIMAAIGAAVGAALPVTQRERKTLGTLGEKARTVVSEQTQNLTSQAREKKDELVGKANDALQSKSETTNDIDKASENQNSNQPFMAGS
ncbi:MAG: DUF3618 domain-containing protein [Sphingorhabdus sp.]